MKFILGTQYISGVFNGLMVLDQDLNRFDLIAALLEPYVNAVDTAPIYARGLSEKSIGLKWQGNIWTKVGVDISSPLPKLDYSLNGMEKSLISSLHRMKTNKINAAFIHNPSIINLNSINFSLIKHEWVIDKKYCEKVGVSLNDISDIEKIKLGNENQPDIIMIESPEKSYEYDLIKYASKYCEVVVRGVFNQGKVFQSRNHFSSVDTIYTALTEIKEKTNVDYCIIAPRTLEQAKDYCDAFMKMY